MLFKEVIGNLMSQNLCICAATVKVCRLCTSDFAARSHAREWSRNLDHRSMILSRFTVEASWEYRSRSLAHNLSRYILDRSFSLRCARIDIFINYVRGKKRNIDGQIEMCLIAATANAWFLITGVEERKRISKERWPFLQIYNSSWYAWASREVMKVYVGAGYK